MRHRTAILIVATVAAAPRLLVLASERETILEEFVEKSDRFARTLVADGTFGFLPGVPSAYTQPLYAWFLAALYWPFGHSWLAVGLAQTAVAVATALVVLAIGRSLGSQTVGLVAALGTTLHPYVVWHDVHVNREVLDGFLLALLTYLALEAHRRRALDLAALTGLVAGIAILGNSRLVLLPALLAVYIAWGLRPARRALVTGAVVLLGAALAVTPWILRNQQQLGCAAITTDSRALWKANNLNTYDRLAKGQWIDDVPELPGAPPWPELAADRTLGGKPTTVDECAQMRLYRDEVIDFWREYPGEKARLARQAVLMLWRPVPTVEGDERSRSGATGWARDAAEPAYILALYALALVGLFVAPRRYVALAVLLLVYNTATAMVFAGTTRYRVPWDFLLALLAGFALVRGWEALRTRRYPRAAAE